LNQLVWSDKSSTLEEKELSKYERAHKVHQSTLFNKLIAAAPTLAVINNDDSNEDKHRMAVSVPEQDNTDSNDLSTSNVDLSTLDTLTIFEGNELFDEGFDVTKIFNEPLDELDTSPASTQNSNDLSTSNVDLSTLDTFTIFEGNELFDENEISDNNELFDEPGTLLTSKRNNNDLNH
jgi:hypothetical protein